jgi:3-oxoacyl-[acyl-carrier-protein] synthase II
MANRAVITGIGIISALGDHIPEICNRIAAGKTAFKETAVNTDLSRRYTGCYDDFTAAPYLGTKGLRHLNRCTRMTLAAAGLALADGGFSITPQNEEEVGVILATNLGVDGHIREMERILFTEGADALSPLSSPFCSINAIAGQVSIRLKPKAFNITVPAGFTSAINGLILARNLIASGRAAMVMAGGAEELPDDLINEYDRHHMLAESPAAMIPFSSRSRGILLGDGAAFLLVEDMERALARGASIYAEVGPGFLAFHPETGDADRERAVGENLRGFFEKNRERPGNVDVIMTSANGASWDQIERKVLLNTFREETRLFNLKTWFGEGFAFTNQLQIGFGAALPRLTELPGAFPLKQLQGEPADRQGGEGNFPADGVNTVLVNSCGPDGTYGSVLLKKYH